MSAKTETKAEVILKVSAKTLAYVATIATATKAEGIAATQKAQTIAQMGAAIVKEYPDAANWAPLQKALMPHFEKAFAAIGKDKLYAGQQLSRVLLMAYPGGKTATPKEREEAKKQLALGEKHGVSQDTKYGLASGSRRINAKTGEVTKVETNRVPHNKTKPEDAMKALVAALFDGLMAIDKKARWDDEQLAVAIDEAATATDFYDVEAIAAKLTELSEK